MHASLSDIVADIAANSIEAGASNIRVSVVDENGTIELKASPASTTSGRSAWAFPSSSRRAMPAAAA